LFEKLFYQILSDRLEEKIKGFGWVWLGNTETCSRR